MSDPDPDPASASLSLPAALNIAVRELRRRRASIQRRGLVARDAERWRPRLVELALAISVIEAFLRSLPDS